jgi:hypothetical protein
METLDSGGGVGAGVPVDEAVEVLFEFQDEGRPPACFRIVDFGQSRVAVEAGNAIIGLLDDAGSQCIREYFRAYPQLHNAVPAVLIGQEQYSGLWIARLGVSGDE